MLSASLNKTFLSLSLIFCFLVPGTQEHTSATQRADTICFRHQAEVDPESPTDVKFVCVGESTKTGDVSFTLRVRNDAPDSRVVDIYLSAVASFYTGVPSVDIKDTATTIVIEPSGGRFLWEQGGSITYNYICFIASHRCIAGWY